MMKNGLCVINYPADFYNHLLETTSGSKSTNDRTLVYRNETGKLRYETKRYIFAPGFELSFSQYALEEDTRFRYYLAYDGIEILAFFDNNFSHPVKVGYELRFPEIFNSSRECDLVLSKGKNICVNLYLDKSWLQEYVDLRELYSERHGWRELNKQAREAFLSVIRQINKNRKYGSAYKIFMEAKAMELLAQILALVDNTPTQPFNIPEDLNRDNVQSLHKAKMIIGQNFNKSISVGDIARMSGMNANRLMSGFKTLFGMTVHNYIVICRMKHALKALETTGMTVSEAAMEAGYTHQGHFIETFKTYYGITPGQFRKNIGTK